MPASGKYIVRGVCTDVDGHAVTGCAIAIGKSIAYSDMRGEWSLRVKKNLPVPLVVDVAQFITMGDYVVDQAPDTVTPGQPITVVVKTVCVSGREILGAK